MYMKRTFFPLFAVGAAFFSADAAVKFGMPFADHAVLQRGRPVAVWGTADPGEKVVVTFGGKKAETTADASGAWRTDIGPFEPSKEGRTLKANDAEVKDVLVGEVWFAGGQSNMGIPLMWVGPRHGDEKGAMIAQYVRRPYIRFAKRYVSWSEKPVRDGSVEWKEFNRETLKSGDGKGRREYGFSAVASYFALELYAELDVPIGIIASYNGGTNIEAWTPREGFESVPELRGLMKTYPVSAKEWAARSKELTRGGIRGAAFRQPTALWNSNIEPFTPFTIRGAIWYQGENNVGDAENYRLLSHALWNGWSKKFENPDLPFYFAQVAPWGHPKVPLLQEAQTAFAAEQPNAAIAIINDLGNLADIHPNRKQTVAQRLALHAFKRLYGYADIRADSPMLEKWRIEGDRFILSFRNVERFYVYNPDRSLKVGFEICGEDGVWKPADIVNFRVTKDRKGREQRHGELDGRDVVVSAKGVSAPKRLRYLHSSPWYGALYSEVNLPVGAFHIDGPK